MTRKTLILLLTIYSLTIFGQTNPAEADSSRSDWKKIIVYHSFEVTKKKKNIPSEILKKIDIDTISQIANPRQKWNSSCVGNKNPRAKLNWAAFTPDKLDWIISVTTGGYSASTTYYLIASDTIEVIRNPGWTGEDFKDFKTKYLSGTIK